jgi:hypothetical protein
MQKLKLLKRSVPLWAVLLICAFSVSLVIAAIMFTTPTATQKMKLAASYNLELYYASDKDTQTPTSWVLVPSGGVDMDWGSFGEGETHFWEFKIKNVGNVAGNVCWRKTGWDTEAGAWTLTVDLGPTQTLEGVTKPLAIGAEMILRLDLKEASAEAGVLYSFGVFVENHDAPLP